ncbi:MAG: DNA adenine methylase [Alphaproteobacteria bacterium GM202ARS2]|nr:DNA adenine methylase [Alphaproteobacteria bacterium GM202ARS2]
MTGQHEARNAHDARSARGDLLHRLRSNGRYRYRRYQGLPLRYAGGKSLAVGHVVEHIPDDVESLVSPFMGGGAVEIACAQELGLRVQAYDVFDILACYWRVQLRDPEGLADRLMLWEPGKATYQRVKARLREHWEGSRLMDDDVELAAHYWFNHNLSYGPGFLGWMSGIYQERERFCRLVDKVRGFRCEGLAVAQGDFKETLARHREDFLYCDPPYYLDGDSRMFRGIYPQRNFPVHHRGFDHGALAAGLARHKGRFILSYNDCEAVRTWYKDCRIVEVAWQYTLGQGETRIGKNRSENGSNGYVKRSHEVLVMNF